MLGRSPGGGHGRGLVLFLTWLSCGCGQVEAGSGLPLAGMGGATGMGGAAGVAGNVSVGGTSMGSNSGAGGEAPVTAEEAADISGRWALFVFEDPVGVQLTQANGQLTGEGCASGTPPDVGEFQSFCGAVSGKVSGRSAQFWFHFQIYTYLANTQISADGQRMTGSLHAVADYDMPTAWLRVPYERRSLAIDLTRRDDPRAGWYTLTLDGADPDATEYDATKTYRLFYEAGRGIASDLGSFWNTEISGMESPAGLQVGPVPATAPELAVSMQLETSADSLSRVRATTGSGHHYEFAAARRVP